ncbi:MULTISPECIES: fimbria/pilus chaperone family protein [Serratia]|uniref:fimbria/pilus chaperone family protein n=1 Tax=Serratia TaxID=613 RepID=UPI000EF486A9|nr:MULTISPECIES: fimbria/pilus chaperone family protein [Serratia]AYM93294.1 fimbrial chaperone protein [Serratia sp. 3ACOL1]MDK2376536.1 fimbria/pilus chaperone family protein [Serratia fonticola]
MSRTLFFKTILTILVIFGMSFQSLAVIMKPETSMVFVDEDGGSINVKNTSDKDALLYVKVYDLPNARQTQPKLLVTQPVTRVGAGKTQRVRFIVSGDLPLKTEYMKRVIFEGIPPKSDAASNKIGINIRQDIPIIIHPKALPLVAEPWKNLKWTVVNESLQVSNPSPYVVRLNQNISVAPSGKKLTLKNAYILPGEKLTLTLDDKSTLSGSDAVTIQTMSKYGYEVGSFEMPISR